MFWDNIDRRITAVSVQLNHAEKKGISNVAKSSYYRAAIILLCTIIEGLVYQLVKKSTRGPKHVIHISKKYSPRHKIPGENLETQKDFYICDLSEEKIGINDNSVGFGKLNVYLKNKNVINTPEYTILENVRKERNKIHLQGLDSSDTGYTKRKFNKLAKSLDFLLKKL